jgi:hypothetical protein
MFDHIYHLKIYISIRGALNGTGGCRKKKQTFRNFTGCPTSQGFTHVHEVNRILPHGDGVVKRLGVAQHSATDINMRNDLLPLFVPGAFDAEGMQYSRDRCKQALLGDVYARADASAETKCEVAGIAHVLTRIPFIRD